jgi:hypothetical protein
LSLSSFNASAHDFILYVKTLTEGLSEQGRIDKSQILPSQLQKSQRTLSNGIGHTNVDHTVTQTESRQKRAAEAVKFEKVLRYADFPDLNYYLPCSPDEFRADHEEVKQVLRWLKLEKGVEEIVKIKVDDRLHTPHEDGAVEYCVKQFKISVLNWRKLDLCLADLDPDQTLRTLHLYSSGNKAVITNWLSKTDRGGVVRLENVSCQASRS